MKRIKELESYIDDEYFEMCHEIWFQVMEMKGYLKAVITQNIDNLHQEAGSQRVLELHGHMREATCMRCYEKVGASPMIAETSLRS